MYDWKWSLWLAGLWNHAFSKAADTLADKKPPLSPAIISHNGVCNMHLNVVLDLNHKYKTLFIV